MPRIHKLSPRVANQIAAGEVITEPLSVVKELVENSLDAGASQIKIEIFGAGLDKIIIKDDGSGIDYDDAGLLFERHATSKISQAQDLKTVTSYGFRGEALASIAAISKITLTSRQEDQLQGFETIIYGGNTLSLKRISRQKGSSFVIEDLFYNTPVREGFLKKPGYLQGKIIDFVRAMALGNPQVSFSLHGDNKLILQSFGRGREEALKELAGEEYSYLIPLEIEGENYRLLGYLSSLSHSMTTRRSQYFLVNNRLVENKELRDLISRTYQGLLPLRRFPVVYFFIDVEPTLVDVNIHPRKMEVRFSHDLSLIEDLEGQLRPFLYGKQIHPVIKEEAPRPKILPKPDLPDRSEELPLSFFDRVQSKKSEELEVAENLLTSYDDFFDGLYYLGQAFSSFLIFQKKNSIYFCDQHAAHEKILYERFMEEYRDKSLSQQLLMLPINLKLDARQLGELEDRGELLRELAFDYEVFSRDSLVLREIPHGFSPGQASSFFRDILEGGAEIGEEELISRACKAAIKAQDALEDVEVDQLLDQLKVLNNPHTCPHGRPIFIEMPRKELERRFER